MIGQIIRWNLFKSMNINLLHIKRKQGVPQVEFQADSQQCLQRLRYVQSCYMHTSVFDLQKIPYLT